MTNVFVPKLEFCYARDYEHKYKAVHQPVQGKYDEELIKTCAWCGKRLTQETQQ